MIPVKLLFWLKLGAIVVICAAVGGIGWTIYHHIDQGGYNRHAAETKVRDDKIAADTAKEMAAQAAAAHETTRLLTASMAKRDFTYQQEQDHANTEKTRLDAALRDRTLRLYIATRGNALPSTCGDRTASPAGGAGTEGRTELDPDSAQFLVGIAAAGDQARRKHAQVVDAYEELRLQCAGPPRAKLPPIQ